MFQGSPHINLDAKGRLSVPSRYREALAQLCSGQMTFTRHPDGCALLYPRSVWETKRTELMALPYSARVFQRIVMGSAVDVDMDASGRLLVPAELRKACGLSKEIVLVGLGSHFELWDAEKLAESEAKAMTENLSDIAAQYNF